MTEPSGSDTRLNVEEIRLAGGLNQHDVPLIEATLRQALARLGAMRGRGLDAELSVRDRDNRGMKTTLEVWVHGLPRIVSTSDLPELRDALNEVGDRTVVQLDETLTRREPQSHRDPS